MLGTGNDIVSLNAINITRTKAPQFYSKILSVDELALYDSALFSVINFENFVWLLWSIKESAYKYLQRIDPEIIFTPVKFEVKQLQVSLDYKPLGPATHEITGKGFSAITFNAVIIYNSSTLYSRSLIFPELIFSVVNGIENFEKTYWGIKFIDDPSYDNQSAAIREFMLENLKKETSLVDVTISKNSYGIPVLLSNNCELPIPVSFSHHEHWIAYSFNTRAY